MCRGPVFVVPQKNPSSRRRLPRSPRRRLTCPYDDMSPVFRNSKHGLHIVIFGKRYGALKPAAQTALNNAVVARRSFKRDGLHHSPAGRRPVARLHVYMFAPETFRTMIGVSIAFNVASAMLASEVLYGSFKHINAPSWPPSAGRWRRRAWYRQGKRRESRYESPRRSARRSFLHSLGQRLANPREPRTVSWYSYPRSARKHARDFRGRLHSPARRYEPSIRRPARSRDPEARARVLERRSRSAPVSRVAAAA